MCCLDMAVRERYCPLKINLLASELDPHIYHGEGIDMKYYPVEERNIISKYRHIIQLQVYVNYKIVEHTCSQCISKTFAVSSNCCQPPLTDWIQ